MAPAEVQPLADTSSGETPMPLGTRLVADRSFEWLADTLVAGGSPWRLLRLSDQGAALVAAWLEGEPVSANPTDGGLARRLVDAGLAHPTTRSRPLVPGEIEVVIPVRDNPSGLEAVLRLCARSSQARVTVVDDGSLDAAAVERISSAHGAKLLCHDVPRGPGAARNTGLHATTAPLVAFLDADTLPEVNWLGELVAHFEDPVVGAVAPRVRGPVGSSLRERFETAASPLDLGDQPGVVRPGTSVPFVPGAAIIVRRSAVAEGFDPTLRVGEDVDLVWRLAANGWHVRYDPSVAVTHAARPNWGRWLAQRFAYGLSAAPLEARHGDAVAPLRADPRVLATVGLVLIGRPRAAIGLLSWSAASLAKQLDGISMRGGNESAARQIAARGTALAAPGLARSTFRTYGPLLIAGAIVVPAMRRPVATVAAAATAVRWWRAGKPQPGLAFATLSVLDDLAYGAGVLAGAVRARRVGALRPRLRPASSVVAPISRT
ncbi:MAG TPA: mycofactocin biosynthesis glycosyltransferase MftF [Acidimicrobiales bacterium]|nr:mycofactocin biosynthesis glycosyltransferase MftF [Acidimicrobiales bacterium]